MGLPRRRFTNEFKGEAVRRLETGTSLAEAACACGVSPNILSRWKRELRGRSAGNEQTSAETHSAELERRAICEAIQMLGSDPRSLTHKEYSLLALLIQHVGVIVPREILLKQIWGEAAGVRTRTLDVHIHRLRKKLGTQADQHIETVCGLGYRFHSLPGSAAQGTEGRAFRAKS